MRFLNVDLSTQREAIGFEKLNEKVVDNTLRGRQKGRAGVRC